MEPAQVVKQLAAPQHGKPGYHRRSAVVQAAALLWRKL
jgi:hypothetical protein